MEKEIGQACADAVLSIAKARIELQKTEAEASIIIPPETEDSHD